MNKPIIIDDVDVAECEFFRDNRPYKRQACCGKPLKLFCDSYPDCDFKQLQRLKAENKGLKQALEEVREIAYTTDFDIRDIQKIVNEVLR